MVLIVGVLVLLFGGIVINNTYNLYEKDISWEFVQTTFLWLLMIIFIMILAINEDIKKTLMINQIKEIRALTDALNRLVKKK